MAWGRGSSFEAPPRLLLQIPEVEVQPPALLVGDGGIAEVQGGIGRPRVREGEVLKMACKTWQEGKRVMKRKEVEAHTSNPARGRQREVQGQPYILSSRVARTTVRKDLKNRERERKMGLC